MCSLDVFLYAGDPIPRSAVCLNHVGSFAPSLRAICSLEAGSSPTSADSGLFGCGLGVERSTIDIGRLPGLRTDAGRCCHDSVPDLPSDVLVVAGGRGGCGGRSNMPSMLGTGMSDEPFASGTLILSCCGLVADRTGVGAELSAGVDASEREK